MTHPEVLEFDPTNRANLAAAFSFQFADLHAEMVSRFTENSQFFKKDLILIESTDDDRYVLFADMDQARFQHSPISSTPEGRFLLEPFSFNVSLYALTRQEFSAGEDPRSGLSLHYRISSANVIDYVIGIFEDQFSKLVITKDDVLHPKEKTLEEKKASLDTGTEYFLGGVRIDGDIEIELLSGGEAIEEFIVNSFPEYKSAIIGTLFSNIVLLSNVAENTMKNVRLKGAVNSIWERRNVYGSKVAFLLYGARDADFIVQDCPTFYSSAYLDDNDLAAVENSVAAGGSSVEMSELPVRMNVDIPDHFSESRRAPAPDLGDPIFSLWLSRELLSETFDYRLGKNLGAMIGAHHADRWGPIKWWLSGAWIIEGISGSLKITTDPQDIARLDVRFDGRTKFDALGYIDIGCFTYELGSFDGFHEEFDFSIFSKLFASHKGRVILVGGFDDVAFRKWRSFIRTFLDAYVSNWKDLVILLVVKYILGEFIRRMVEDEVTGAMGSMSVEVFDFTQLPIIGGIMKDRFSPQSYRLASICHSVSDGIDITIGGIKG